MSLNKPIVTTDMKDCIKYKSVLIGKDHYDFLDKMDEAYKLKNDNNYKKILDEEARDNDWSHKAKVIVDLVKKDE